MVDRTARINDAFNRVRASAVQKLADRIQALGANWQNLVAELAAEGDGLQTAALRERVLALSHDVHRISGSFGTFGYPDVSAAAAPLEQLLNGFAEADRISPERLTQAARMVDRVRGAWVRCSAGTEGIFAAGNLTDGLVSNGERTIGIIAADHDGAGEVLTAMVIGLGYPVLRIVTDCAPVSDLAALIVDEAAPGAHLLSAGKVTQCPVLLSAGSLSFSGRLAAARAGVTAILTKPPDPDELADWLDALAGRGGQAPFSILVVDDDVLLAEAYALTLQRAGMQVTVVSEPDQAVEAMATTHHDLVLMNLHMPEIDGIELARVIRQTRRYLFLPIVFLSAEQDIDRQLMARQVGGDDFIRTPVDLDRLVRLVRLRAERARALRTVMERDSLTGLLNHSRFKERLAQELDRNRRNGSQLSLALIDLDHFKKVNDSYGHLIGDRVIRALARGLTTGLRKSDVVGRYGGEEFAAILLDSTPAQSAGAIDAVRRRFGAHPFETEHGSFNVTLSAGVAGASDYADAEMLIEAADRALYAAKRGGRDNVRIDGVASWALPQLTAEAAASLGA
jgi:diguanylate cyclase (GGDEF)-like protein